MKLFSKRIKKECSKSAPKVYSSFSKASFTEDQLNRFYWNHAKEIQPLEHLIVPPQVIDYGDVETYKKALEISIQAVHELEKICYTSDIGIAWFDQQYHHCFNSHTSDFSLIEKINDLYTDLISNYQEYEVRFQRKTEAKDFLFTHGNYIRKHIIESVKANPGILQKDIYKCFEPDYKQSVISVLQSLVKERVLFRLKHGNTFELYLEPPIGLSASVPRLNP